MQVPTAGLHAAPSWMTRPRVAPVQEESIPCPPPRARFIVAAVRRLRERRMLAAWYATNPPDAGRDTGCRV